MKKLNTALLLSCLLTLFACGFDEPGNEDNDDDDLDSGVISTTQEINLDADAAETAVALPASCKTWRLADDAPQEDWFEIATEEAEMSPGTIPIRVKFNLTGESRFATIGFDITTESGAAGRHDVCLTQSPVAHDGRNMHLTLPTRFISGRDIFVSSSTIDFDKEPLHIIFGNNTAPCEVYNMHNVRSEIPDMEPGEYPLSVRIGESTYDIGQAGVYTLSENDCLPAQKEPRRYNPQWLKIVGIVNTGAQNPHTTALLSDNTTSPVIFSDSEENLFAIPMTKISRLNSRYFAFSYLGSDSEMTYDDVNYTAFITRYEYSTVIVDMSNGMCHTLPVENIDPETIKWTGVSNSGRDMFIAGRRDLHSFEISDDHIMNIKSLGTFSIGDYPYPIGCGNMIALGNGKLLVNGEQTSVAPYSTNNSTYHFESGDAHARLTDVPVYGLGALFRVVNYSRLNSSGNRYMHEIMVEAMDGSAIIATDAWDNEISAGRQYLAFCLEESTYLRPHDEAGSCIAMTLDRNGAQEEQVRRATKTDPEIAMNPQPYYGNYIYLKSGGKICRMRIDDYSGNTTPLDVSDSAFCALGPGKALFAETTPDGLRVSSFDMTSEKTGIFHLPDFGFLGQMISF